MVSRALDFEGYWRIRPLDNRPNLHWTTIRFFDLRVLSLPEVVISAPPIDKTPRLLLLLASQKSLRLSSLRIRALSYLVGGRHLGLIQHGDANFRPLS